MSNSYREALAFMEGLLTFGWKLGNERFTALCDAMGNPQNQYAVVHVTGTKGKGSTTAMAAGILTAAGHKTGGYFSPYVFDVRERVQTDGRRIGGKRFADIVARAQPYLTAIAATELGQTTEFELKTLIGFEEFALQHAEYACIEVGIGGRLDATNIVRPTACVITNIGLDHTHILGDTHELIAGEKAGIIKAGVPCFTACDHPGALRVISNRAAELDAPLMNVRRGPAGVPTGTTAAVHWEPAEFGTRSCSEQCGGFRVATQSAVYEIPGMALVGEYQRLNAACAIAAAETALRRHSGEVLQPEPVAEALAKVALPGRFSVYKGPGTPWIVMDGAHNALAAKSLTGPLYEFRTRYEVGKTAVVMGMLTGHDPEPVAAELLRGASLAVACAPKWKRALPAAELGACIQGIAESTEIVPDVKRAVRRAIGVCSPQDLLLISGSFYTVGECNPGWLKRSFGASEVRDLF